ncbi:MAG: hypothetical protein HQL83_15995 [Magnetococcales bacterium]|nr:hypothetical protein [Magnetococcales bacterium]
MVTLLADGSGYQDGCGIPFGFPWYKMMGCTPGAGRPSASVGVPRCMEGQYNAFMIAKNMLNKRIMDDPHRFFIRWSKNFYRMPK